MTAQQLQQRKQRQSTVPRSRNGISRRLILTATTTTAQRQHITKHATLNVETPAIAIVERNISYLKRVVIPADTRVIGTVSVQQSHDRAIVTWHTIVFPEGDEIKLSGIALSLDGSAGLKGKVETHKDSAVANTVLRSVVSGTQAALDITGVSPITSQATQGISQEALKELDVQKQQVTTSITVDADTGLRVYVNQRLEY